MDRSDFRLTINVKDCNVNVDEALVAIPSFMLIAIDCQSS